MISKFFEQQNSGFSVLTADELYFIGGGSVNNDSSDSSKKGYDTTWELSVNGEVRIDTNGNVEPKINIVYTVHK